MKKGKILLEKQRFQLTIERLCFSLIENYDDFSNTCIIGIQPRGTLLAQRIKDRLDQILDTKHLKFGKLDITFYRDDFRTRNVPLTANAMDLDFIIEDKKIILVDDVLYTGRTIQAALSALQDFGRPAHVELLTLVDRRFNRNIPIQPDYAGLTVDALDEAYIKVKWSHLDMVDQVILFENKEAAEKA